MDKLKEYIYKNMYYSSIFMFDEDEDNDEPFDYYEASAWVIYNGHKFYARYAGTNYNYYNILVDKLAHKINRVNFVIEKLKLT